MRRFLTLTFLSACLGLCNLLTAQTQIGTSVHFAFGQGKLEDNLALIKQAGIRFVRDEYNWSSVEGKKGEYVIDPRFTRWIEKTHAAGMTPLVVLCYGNPHYEGGSYPTTPESIEAYTRYAEAVVRSMPNQKRYVEIWNEWDGGCGMDKRHGKGNVDAYVALIKAVYPRLKAIDPDITVLGGSFCSVGVLESALKKGLANSCDALSLHTYNYEEVLSAGAPEDWAARMERVNQMLTAYYPGKNPRLFVTEMGWPTHIGAMGSTEVMQAAHASRFAFLAATTPNLECAAWYDFQNDGNDCYSSENNFGLVRSDLTPKPSWYALRDTISVLSGAQSVVREKTSDAGLWMLRIKKKDGNDSVVLWSSLDESLLQVELEGPAQAVQMRHAGRASVPRDWGFYDWVDERDQGVRADRFSITVGNLPVIIEGKDLSQAHVARVRHCPFDERKRAQSKALRLPSQGVVATPKGTQPYVIENKTGAGYIQCVKPWEGPDDLSYSFHIQYDEKNVYWTITVSDDIFSQAFAGDETWNADGIQMALQTSPNAGDGDRTEFDLALTSQGTKLFLRSNRLGLPAGISDLIPAEVKREGKNTVYHITIPAKALKLEKWEAGMMFTASFLVNDADQDSKVRRGYLQWGSGIGLGRKPELYNLVVLAKE